jgi:hypothetical protein
VQTRLEGLVKAKYAKAIDQHRDILAEQFPTIKEEQDLERMSENFKEAFEPLIKRMYGEKLKAEFARMYQTWDEFPVDNTKRSHEELSQELYHLLFALMQHKLAAANQAEPAAQPAPKANGS